MLYLFARACSLMVQPKQVRPRQRTDFENLVFETFTSRLFDSGSGDGEGLEKSSSIAIRLRDREHVRKLWKEAEDLIRKSIEEIASSTDAPEIFGEALDREVIAAFLWRRFLERREDRKTKSVL